MANNLLYKDITKYSYWMTAGQLPYTSDRSIANYKKMRYHPMCALGINFLTLGLPNVPFIVDSSDETIKAITEAMLKKIWNRLLKDTFESIIYGFKPFEIRYELGKLEYEIDGEKKEYNGILYKQPKALDPEYVRIMVEEDGSLKGFKQDFTTQEVLVKDRKCFIAINQFENGNYYGTSVLENVYSMWYISNINMQFHTRWLERKGTGLFIGRYPVGKQEDGTDNSTVMNEILDSLMEGTTLALPSGSDENGKPYWDVYLLDSQDKTDSFIQFHEYLDKMILRGLIIPERALTQGEIGARASVEAYIDIFTTRKQDILDTAVENINNYLLPHFIELNFGKDINVTLIPGKIDDNTKVQASKIIEKLVEQKGIDIDIKWLVEKTGIPIQEQEENIAPITPQIEEQHDHGKEEEIPDAKMSEDRFQSMSAREKKYELADIGNFMNQISERFQADIKSNLQAQFERIKGYLNKNLGSGSLDVADSIEINRNAIRKIYKQYLEEVYAYCYDKLSKNIGKVVVMAGESPFIGFRVSMSAEKLATDVETAIKYSVAQGILRGQSISETIDNAANAMNDMTSVSRLSNIAETEISFVMSKANEVYLKDNHRMVNAGQLPPQQKIMRYQYSAILDGKVCPLCAKLDKMVVNYDSPIRYKYDPPLHYFCRCFWMPITQGEINDPRIAETDLTIDMYSGKPYTLDAVTAMLGTDIEYRTFK